MSNVLQRARAFSNWMEPLMPDVALKAERPRVRLCPECRDGKHRNCTGVAFTDDTDEQVPCPCHDCHPPTPQRCTSCGFFINPMTGECAGCSD